MYVYIYIYIHVYKHIYIYSPISMCCSASGAPCVLGSAPAKRVLRPTGT